MDTSLANTIVSTGGAVIVGISGMFLINNQFGKRLDGLRQDLRHLSAEFHNFKDTVNGKFAQLDLEISKLMDK